SPNGPEEWSQWRPDLNEQQSFRRGQPQRAERTKVQMMTMTPRDDIPTRDKPMIPTHRRVRAVVWLLAPRTSSRPAAHRDALKGRTYGRTASRPGKSHIKILARRDRSTYGITTRPVLSAGLRRA